MPTDAPIRIAVASFFDVRDPSTWSGSGYNLVRSLERHGAEIIPLGPLEHYRSWRASLAQRYHRLRGRNYKIELTEPSLRWMARQLTERLRDVDCDCVLGLDSFMLAHLEIDRPIYYFWDCTFEGNLEYPNLARLAPECLATGHCMERAAIARSRVAMFSSRWAVRSAIETYGADPARVGIVPIGANIVCDRTEADIERLLDARPTDRLHLLFLGVDWVRKGGDLAMAVAGEMNRRGVPTTLHVVGCAPPPGEVVPDFVELHGFLDKRAPAEFARLQALFGRAHFLIVPSLAESFGAVFAEAASFGTPSLSRRVGGIDAAVEEGVSGYLFDRDAGPAPYADRIERLWRDPAAYLALALASFRHFNARLTWDYAGGKMMDYIRADLARAG